MDFYRTNEEYNKFLQRYEKEKRGVTKVPNIRYTDRIIPNMEIYNSVRSV